MKSTANKTVDHITSRKKISKFSRKFARQAVDERFKTVSEMLKPKPKYLPVWLWKWLIKEIVDLNIYRKKGGLL